MTPEQYIASIRSKRKKAYALAYLKHLRHRNVANPDWGELSYMAAQSVRFMIHELEKGGGQK